MNFFLPNNSNFISWYSVSTRTKSAYVVIFKRVSFCSRLLFGMLFSTSKTGKWCLCSVNKWFIYCSRCVSCNHQQNSETSLINVELHVSEWCHVNGTWNFVATDLSVYACNRRTFMGAWSNRLAPAAGFFFITRACSSVKGIVQLFGFECSFNALIHIRANIRAVVSFHKHVYRTTKSTDCMAAYR